MILNTQSKRIPKQIFPKLSSLVFFAESLGFHTSLIYCDNEKQFAALVAGGGELEKVNRKRYDAEMYPVKAGHNVQQAKAAWGSVCSSGDAMILKLHWHQSINVAEKLIPETLEQLRAFTDKLGLYFDWFDNTGYTVICVSLESLKKVKKEPIEQSESDTQLS